jgi:hypothetical protein
MWGETMNAFILREIELSGHKHGSGAVIGQRLDWLPCRSF